MSSDYHIVGDFLMLPAVLAAAPFIGVGYAVFQDSRAAKRYQKEEKRHRQLQLTRQQKQTFYPVLARMYHSYETAAGQQEQQIEEQKQLMEKKLSALTEEYYEAEHDAARLEAFERRAKEKQEELRKEWQQTRGAMEEKFHVLLHQTTGRIARELSLAEEGKRALEAMAEENPVMAEKVYERIEQAKAAIVLYQIETGEEPKAMRKELNQAISYARAQNYEIAYSKASGVMLHCLEEMEQAKQLQQEYILLWDEIARILEVTRERLGKMRSLEFSWKGETLEEDLFRFEPDVLNGISLRLDELEKEWKTEQKFSIRAVIHLKRLLEECRETDEDAVEIGNYAVKRMLYAYSENEHAEQVTDRLEEQGFRMTDHAYAADLEGNPLHINFLHEITGEKLTVVLTPAESGVRISVHNYGRNGEETGNMKTQQAVQRTLEQCFQRKGICHGLGAVSRQTEAAQLDRVRTMPERKPEREGRE